MKIETAANKFYKSINDKIEFEIVEKYLKKLGYEIVFFNTPVGDNELARYGQTEKAKTSKAFTYVGTAKIIFINDSLSVEDKLYVLLHEVGHIELKHLDYERLGTHNKILLDVDADAFVYFVLNKKRKPVFPILLLVFAVISSACILFFTFPRPADTPANNFVAEEAPEYVVITPTGSRYHRESCRSISESFTANIEISEAKKLFSPCNICNP